MVLPPALPRPLLAALLLSSALLLAGCESSEDKAERFYQSGLAFLESGDEERALIEFRNVFQNDGFHKEARQAYADLQLRRGETTEAYGQYLRLIEQYPDTPDVRLRLAELAIARGDWEEAERHGGEAVRLAPDVPEAQAVDVALRYRAAVTDDDEAAREEVAREARVLLAGNPDLRIARRVAIDWLMAGPNPQDALPEIERALEAEPDAIELHVMKVRLLIAAGDEEATGAQLKEMYDRFPDNQEVRTALIQWYLSQDDLDGAEAFLRELAGEDTGATEGHVAVVQLLQAARGPEAAKAELDRLAAANAGTPNADLYRAMSAGIDFQAGRQGEAIAAFEDILAAAEPSDQTRRIKAMLARMLVVTGDQVGARARVEEVLAEDATNADALRLRAAWAIQEDRPGEAIVDLRTALSQDPRDVEALTLMAEAHERDGSLDLAGERLALAVEVSNSAPEPSLRYADFLVRQGRDGAAETVLLDAKAADPDNFEVTVRLAELAMRAGEYDRVEERVAELASLGTQEGERAAQSLRAALLLARGRTEDGLEVLRSIAAEGEGAGAVARIVETMLRDDRGPEARAFLDAEIAKDPDSPDLRLMSAGLHAAMGEVAEAEALYRELIADAPGADAPVRLLYGLLAREGRAEEATAVLEAGLAARPDSGTLRWIQAGERERAGDIDGAIAIYEELYAEDSGNVVVANNLASLISAHRDDPESLDRAFAVARRLRGSDEPAFQDTYGWIAYRRGEFEDALAHLEPAAAGLPQDPLVQYHLGLLYADLGRTDDAVRQLERALELAGDSDLPQFAAARERLAALRAGPAEDAGAPAAADPAADPAPVEAPVEEPASAAEGATEGAAPAVEGADAP